MVFVLNFYVKALPCLMKVSQKRVITSMDTSFASVLGFSPGLVMVEYDIMRSLPRDCSLGSNDLDPVEDSKSIIFVP
jgi:hypothetical protein